MAKNIKAQLKEIERKLNPIINDAMHNDMYDMLVEKGKKEVDETVYAAYTPSDSENAYKRTYKLRDDSWAKEMPNQGLVFTNIRKDSKTGKYIPKVIETGEGYDITGNPPFEYEKPRPFMGNLKEWLRTEEQHVEVMKKAMRDAGFKVTKA